MTQQPIDVGSRNQLFIDKRFIDGGENVELTMNPPYMGEARCEAVTTAGVELPQVWWPSSERD